MGFKIALAGMVLITSAVLFHTDDPSTPASPTWHVDCTKYQAICLHNLQSGERWKVTPDYDGHHNCKILIGDTTLFACRDGFLETS